MSKNTSIYLVTNRIWLHNVGKVLRRKTTEKLWRCYTCQDMIIPGDMFPPSYMILPGDILVAKRSRGNGGVRVRHLECAESKNIVSITIALGD